MLCNFVHADYVLVGNWALGSDVIGLRRWDAIVVAGNAKPEDVYVLADAESCKPLERWGLGRGLDVASIINTGGTGRWGGL